MSNVFAEYLLQQHELPIPGVGLLKWEPTPAGYDVANRHFNAPGGNWHFTPVHQIEGSLPLQRLTGHIALWQNMTEEEAYEHVQSFGSLVQAQLSSQQSFAVAGLGKLQIQQGDVVFAAAPAALWLAPLPAERVIREGASHQMLVGDQETTTAEMEAFLAEEEPLAADRWWLWPVVLAIIALALILWRRLVETGA